MNSKLITQQTELMARALLADSEMDERMRTRLAYESAFGRPPSDNETARALDFIERYGAALRSKNADAYESRLRSWQALCRTILASSEFIYVE
jgi:hypothetical protein